MFIFGNFDLGFVWFYQKVAETRELLSKQAVQTKEILSKQAVKIAKQAEEHESFISKVGLFNVLWTINLKYGFDSLQWRSGVLHLI